MSFLHSQGQKTFLTSAPSLSAAVCAWSTHHHKLLVTTYHTYVHPYTHPQAENKQEEKLNWWFRWVLLSMKIRNWVQHLYCTHGAAALPFTAKDGQKKVRWPGWLEPTTTWPAEPRSLVTRLRQQQHDAMPYPAVPGTHPPLAAPSPGAALRDAPRQPSPPPAWSFLASLALSWRPLPPGGAFLPRGAEQKKWIRSEYK